MHEVGATAADDSSFRVGVDDICSPLSDEEKVTATKSLRSVTSPSSSSTSSHKKVDKAISVDLEEEDKLSTKSKTSELSANFGNRLADLPARTPDLANISRSDIQGMLECLTQRVRDIEAGERGDRGSVGDVAEVTEVADSGRAESIASGVSSVSSRGRARRVDEVNEYDPETQSTLRMNDRTPRFSS